jgi:transmembrane sensor
MTTTDQQIRSAVTQLAADWYMAHRTRRLSEGERATFFAWLKASPIHIEEYLGVAALERILPQATDHPRITLAELATMARNDPSTGVVELNAGSRGTRVGSGSARGFWGTVAAFGILCTVGIGAWWVTHSSPSPDHPTLYQTAHGAQGTWRLPDGSTLRLDSDTAVTVHFSSAGRLVELDRGQIWAAVAHDTGRPFRVQAGSAQVLAVGTEFDVYRRRDSTLVTVLEGQVVVSAPSAASPRALRVAAGQEVKLIDGVLPAAAVAAHRSESMAWLERKIVFERRPLGEVAEEFNRYNAIPFAIDDPALRRLPISGNFDESDEESFTAFLQTLPGVRIDKRPTSVIIMAASASSDTPRR